MGKKIIYKQLRKIAATLPTLSRPIVVGEKRVSGHTLIAELGAEEAALRGIKSPKGLYNVKRNGYIPLNHERQLKDAYNHAGMKAVAEYVGAILARKKEIDSLEAPDTVETVETVETVKITNPSTVLTSEEDYRKHLTDLERDMIDSE